MGIEPNLYEGAKPRLEALVCESVFAGCLLFFSEGLVVVPEAELVGGSIDGSNGVGPVNSSQVGVGSKDNK